VIDQGPRGIHPVLKGGIIVTVPSPVIIQHHQDGDDIQDEPDDDDVQHVSPWVNKMGIVRSRIGIVRC
jgi:hypothetical protein